MSKYDKCVDFWDGIFENEAGEFPNKKESGNKDFDKGLEWLASDAKTVLDFGCGNGSLLFLSSYYGTKTHIGIDLSKEAIASAKARCKDVKDLEFDFKCGGIDSLKEIEKESMDSLILSNIVDNLYPEDAKCLLEEVERVLKSEGKCLVKLNPYITEEQIKEWDIKIIENNFLDDGLLLWNNTTEEWDSLFGAYFKIEKFTEVYYEEHDQYNRMYCLIKK